MTIKINEINSINKKNINFKAKEKQDNKELNQNKEEKSFYERNKNALIALGVIGAAAVAIGTHHLINNSTVDKISKKSRKALEEFKEKLGKLNKDDDPSTVINPILSENNSKLKIDALDYLINQKDNFINAGNWENIFNNLISLKPSNAVKSSKISGSINEFYGVIDKKGLVNTEALDKIIAKLSESSDDIKLNLSQRLIQNTLDQSKVNIDQSKKIIDILNGVKQEKFDYRANSCISYKDYSTAGIKYHYYSKIFKETKIDKNYIKNIKDVLNSNALTGEMKLQLIDDIYLSKTMSKDTKESMQVVKEMLSAFEHIEAKNYSRPNSFISFINEKFNLGVKLLSHADILDRFKVFSNEEKLKIAQNLKEMAKNTKVDKSYLNGNVHYINDIYASELKLKNKVFFEKMTPETSLDDFEKFTDEMLSGYKEAKEHFIKGDNIFEQLDEDKLKWEFTIFKQESYIALMKKQLDNIFSTNPENIKKIDKIIDKIEKFGQKHFKMNDSKYYNNSGNAKGNKFNFNDYVKDTTQKAKDELTDFLSKDDTLKDLAEKLKTEGISEELLKQIKKKFVIKYHPDKVSDDKKAEATQTFQNITNLLDILGKTLN